MKKCLHKKVVENSFKRHRAHRKRRCHEVEWLDGTENTEARRSRDTKLFGILEMVSKRTSTLTRARTGSWGTWSVTVLQLVHTIWPVLATNTKGA
jgi:hypothetical protein